MGGPNCQFKGQGGRSSLLAVCCLTARLDRVHASVLFTSTCVRPYMPARSDLIPPPNQQAPACCVCRMLPAVASRHLGNEGSNTTHEQCQATATHRMGPATQEPRSVRQATPPSAKSCAHRCIAAFQNPWRGNVPSTAAQAAPTTASKAVGGPTSCSQAAPCGHGCLCDLPCCRRCGKG